VKSGSERQKPYVFSHMWMIDPKDKHIHKNKHDPINSHVEHVCNSETILWNSRKEGKEKRTLEHQQYHKT
jgi:hypothetical protein